MPASNRERVGRGFELLAAGLGPYIDRQMPAVAQTAGYDDWVTLARERLRLPRSSHASPSDPHFQLRTMVEFWRPAFEDTLGRYGQTLARDLQEARNRWAHNQAFTFEDAWRTLDGMHRLLVAVSASQAAEVERERSELMRLRYERQARDATPSVQALATQHEAALRPWREVVTPHEDVATGRFQQAEFAADLAQVHRREGAAEYADPVEFFRRTYLTEGLRDLLAQAVERVTGAGGVPVVDLQTNFGGGKTHSLLALYHLLGGTPLRALPQEVQDVVADAGVDAATGLPSVRRAVLVGTALSPGQATTKADGTVVRTLWGELAWQLGGRDAYEHLKEADETATNPGEALHVLLAAHAPCLVLIDEWVAYARQLYNREGLPAGTFDTHFSFAQALTEAARATPGVLAVISIPASESRNELEPAVGGISEIEIGGVAGVEALRRLRNVIGRMESSWRPATAVEAFEIVRRRLFDDIDVARLRDRDVTARAFGEHYRRQAGEFPAACREPSYVERIKAAYPIHPELFARLYGDWSTLERFQRTRGVLRLMAAVVHALWTRDDKAPLVLPASVPLDDPRVVSELTRHLEDNWKPIIDTDIDGADSAAVALDRAFTNLGRYSAARRVARTVFLGSAPRVRTPNRGVDSQRIRLGCALPGESVAILGDALNRLTDRATYLYADGARYWFGVQPGVARIAADRAERIRRERRDDIHDEIVRRLRAGSDRGEFTGVHVAPMSSGDVPDDPSCRLVLLAPTAAHVARSEDSPAVQAAREILERRGNAQRMHRNMLVFLAADRQRLDDLEHGIAEYLAWRSVDDEARSEALNLDAHQARQARTKHDNAEQAVTLRLTETYQWVVTPSQPDPTGPVRFEAGRVDGHDGLATRASRKLLNDGMLYVTFPAVLLRRELDERLATLWEQGHVSASDVWDAFARYVYLPRLRDQRVLLQAVADGPAITTWQTEGFATADGITSSPLSGDEADQPRYLGLAIGAHASSVSGATLLVRPADALRQVNEDDRYRGTSSRADATSDGPAPPYGRSPTPSHSRSSAFTTSAPTRFYGIARLSADRPSRDFAKVADEVIAHLTGHLGTDVEVTVEVRATNPDGFPDGVTRTIMENANTLRFNDHAFEED